MKNENLIERKIEKRYYRNFFDKFYDILIAFKDPKHEFILATLDDIDDAFINTGKPVLQKLYRLLNTRKPGKITDYELYWDSEEDHFYLMETANKEDEDDYLLMFTEFTFNNQTITIYTEK